MTIVRIIIIIIFFLIITVFYKSTTKEVVYVKSEIDGQEYLVRDLIDKQKAANMLARLKKNMNKLTNYLYQNRSNYKEYNDYIEQLKKRIKDVVILESTDDSMYTSYSVNKGEQIIYCLRSKKIKNKIHDINLLMYVCLHEMAHVACPEYDHTPLFKKIFAFFTEVAINIGIYKKIEFVSDPVEYCGLIISESII
jgi:predicted metal-dependent hydrolase